jgi:hypothetical protein
MADEQIAIFEQEFELENWRAEGQDLVKDLSHAHGNSLEIEQAKNAVKWKIADWLLFGQGNIKDDKAIEIEVKKLAGMSRRTAWDYIRTARAFPQSRRRDSLSWSHHKEVAIADFDAATQDRLLIGAEIGKLSVLDLRAAAKKELRKADKKAPKEPLEPDVVKKRSVKVAVKLDVLHYKLLRNVFDARDSGKSYYGAEEFIYLIVCDWIAQNFDSLLEDAKKTQPQWEKLKPEFDKLLRGGADCWNTHGVLAMVARDEERLAEDALRREQHSRQSNQQHFFDRTDSIRAKLIEVAHGQALEENDKRKAETAA